MRDSCRHQKAYHCWCQYSFSDIPDWSDPLVHS